MGLKMDHKLHWYFSLFLTAAFLLTFCSRNQKNGAEQMDLSDDVRQSTISELVKKFGETQKNRIETGVQQVSQRWKKQDGTAEEFREFCLNNFTADEMELTEIFERFQEKLEILYGNFHQVSRNFSWELQVDAGKVIPLDYLFANYNVFAHVSDDFFKTKIAFAALLNFSLESLENKNSQGMKWSRKKWAKVRLAEEFSVRVPSAVAQKRSEAYTVADDYISNYNIYMNNLLDNEGNRLFPEGLKLISHWGLRDELKGQYANKDALERQKMIQEVMRRIIRQEIPEKVINSDEFDWNPYTNKVFKAGTDDRVDMQSESDNRYKQILNIFNAEKSLDPYYPHAPSLIDRRFKISREMPESDVETELKRVLSAPVLKDIAGLIENRLDRSLEPFDIWYNGFKSRSRYNEQQLDEIVGKRYPTVDAFEKDIPYILRNLGFAPDKASFLANHIKVDPSRGAGHAMGAMMSSDDAHLRTRIPEGGMKYKGYNIAIHELGHNVEQVLSLNLIDYYTLNGVPNTAFTEAFAFVFQSRDLDILGLRGDSENAINLQTLNNIWATFEISGVALTDMYIWRWMYDHPDATPQELKEAMIQIARKNWNDYFAPVLGMKDQELLAIYSHIVDGGMYTPDYPLGLMISFQIEEYLRTHNLPEEMERMCKLGRLAPQIWMQKAVGEKVSAQPLIDSAKEAIGSVQN